jgi:hypothetical protein
MMTPILLCAGLLNGPVIARLPLTDGLLDIRFVHSLSATPVVMHFASDGHTLYLTGSTNVGDGADLPYPDHMKMKLEYVTHMVMPEDELTLLSAGRVLLRPAEITPGPWHFELCPKPEGNETL